MKLFYFSIFFFTAQISCLTAQVTLVASSALVRSGDSVAVELKALSRDTLSTLQFTLTWDPSVLTFNRLDTLGGLPPSAETSEYGLTNVSQGRMSFIWIERTIGGFRVRDSVGVFKIVFKAIGANGTSSAIQFTGSPTSIRASNARLLGISVTSQNGLVRIGTSSVSPVDTEGGLQLEQNTPNPVDNHVTIRFSTPVTENISLAITDLTGRTVLIQERFFTAGRHEWRLNTEGVLSRGFYVYSIRTKSAIVSKRLFKI
jgi:hypothetical protein